MKLSDIKIGANYKETKKATRTHRGIIILKWRNFMKRYFETYKEARSFMETVTVIDYGVKSINGQKIYWVLYEKD